MQEANYRRLDGSTWGVRVASNTPQQFEIGKEYTVTVSRRDGQKFDERVVPYIVFNDAVWCHIVKGDSKPEPQPQRQQAAPQDDNGEIWDEFLDKSGHLCRKCRQDGRIERYWYGDHRDYGACRPFGDWRDNGVCMAYHDWRDSDPYRYPRRTRWQSDRR